MNAFDWIYQIVVEGLKYIILGHCFLGFPFRQDKAKFWLAGYFLMIPVVEILDIPHTVFIYFYSWGALLIIFLFEGKFIEKIKAFFVMWFLIAMVDALIMVQFLAFIEPVFTESYVKKLLGIIGAVFWVILAWKAKKLQFYMKQWWEKITRLEYIIIILSFFAVAILLGGIQSYLYQAMNVSIRKVVFIVGILVVVLFLSALLLLFYTRQSKKRLEEVNQLNMQYFNLQKRYYEDSLEQYEDMRRFRHDINNHIFMMTKLSEENRIDELKKYISEMSKNYESLCSIHTGNFIADCMISRTVQELEKDKDFVFELDGHFPKSSIMEDIDLCALLSNLLDNAREALEKVETRKYLQIEVKRYQSCCYLVVRNTVQDEKIDFSKSSKTDQKSHGYGIKSIRKIVEKYCGEVTWKCTDNMVEVRISLLIE